ncbi:MAG: hypothetical protein KC613_26815 [Myxococcales bacterium]|nr:hypothetical protein [Myxococcales bacterium]MCB9523474.1 hypothetical protein [Myxococcales bacterium]
MDRNPPLDRKPVVIFSSLNLAEAHLVHQALRQARLKATLRNALRAPLMGEIPADDARAEVTVAPEDEAAAQAVIAALEAQGQGDEWACRDCGEANPASFEICWQCGRAHVP